MRLIIFTFLFSVQGFFAQVTPTYNNIWIPTRDGDSLQADVYIPAGVDSSEVILIQTPYDKNNFENGLPLRIGTNVNNQPYIWVIVDWRGFYGSNNADLSNFSRGEDGYDICQWISQQSWHKSRIGTWGPSALGGVQYNTAAEQHPNHTCAVPLVANPQTSYDGYYFGGVLEKARLISLDALGYGLSPIVLANPYSNNSWTFAENNSYYPPQIAIPTLQIGGWYDHNIDKMVRFYEDCRNLAALNVRDKQWLLVGPWVHGGTGPAYVGSSIQGELSYPDAAFRSDTMARKFFDYFLLDSANNWQNESKITYYNLGSNVNKWLTTNASTISMSGTNSLYLNGFKTLTANQGSGYSEFICDPRNPNPTLGGATLSQSLVQGPVDQTSLNNRNDVIYFASEILTEKVTTAGRIKLQIFLSSNQPDGDLAVRLVDQYPDGRNMLITDGIKRIRFRNGYRQTDEVFMTPGEVYSVEVDLPFTQYTWLPGHAIKIYISGNHASRFDVNLQNGGTMYAAGDTNTANYRIYHSDTYPSRIILPGNNPILGLNGAGSTDGLMIYPNPSAGIVHLSEQNVINLQVHTMDGRLVMRNLRIENGYLDLSSLSNNLYVISGDLENGSHFYTRVLIQK